MNGSRCGTWEPSSHSGSTGTAFGVPGEREPLLRDAVLEELGPTGRGQGLLKGGLTSTTPSSTEVSRLQSQLSWQQRWRRRSSGKMYLVMLEKAPDASECFHVTQALLFFYLTFPPEKHRTIDEISKLKGSHFLHFTMKMGRFSQAWKSTCKIIEKYTWKGIALSPGLGRYLRGYGVTQLWL